MDERHEDTGDEYRLIDLDDSPTFYEDVLRFADRCNAIESVLGELGLHQAADKDGKTYGERGLYMLDRPISVYVTRDRHSRVFIELHMFRTEWDEEIDIDDFYGFLTERAVISLERTPEGKISYRTVMPAVPEEIFRQVFRSTMEFCLEMMDHFNSLAEEYKTDTEPSDEMEGPRK